MVFVYGLQMDAQYLRPITILGVLFFGVPIIRTIVFWGLYWGPLILGKYHISDGTLPMIRNASPSARHKHCHFLCKGNCNSLPNSLPRVLLPLKKLRPRLRTLDMNVERQEGHLHQCTFKKRAVSGPMFMLSRAQGNVSFSLMSIYLFCKILGGP